MKKETKEALLSAIRQNPNISSEDIGKLFRLYLSLEIKNVQDLLGDHYEFSRLIGYNAEYFSDYLHMGGYIMDTAFAEPSIFSALDNNTFPGGKARQESFVNEIEALVGGEKTTKILDVGSGEVPYSSILLASRGYDVASMDNFRLSEQCLSNLGVKSFRQLFDDKTDVASYDIVIGRNPCGAIRQIVKSCAVGRVPYFIRLCDCYTPNADVKDWKQILPIIDKEISFGGSYAYNLNNANFTSSKPINEIIAMDPDEYKGL